MKKEESGAYHWRDGNVTWSDVVFVWLKTWIIGEGRKMTLPKIKCPHSGHTQSIPRNFSLEFGPPSYNLSVLSLSISHPQGIHVLISSVMLVTLSQRVCVPTLLKVFTFPASPARSEIEPDGQRSLPASTIPRFWDSLIQYF